MMLDVYRPQQYNRSHPLSFSYAQNYVTCIAASEG